MRRFHRLAGSIIAAGITVGWAGAASAHVTVHPEKAQQGGFQKLTFQVPTELPDSPTVKLKVQLPKDHPLAFVSVKPKAGWTITMEKVKLDKPFEAFGEQITDAVSTVMWEGGAIKPGEFDEFDLSVGPLPTDTKELSFPTLQTYGNGEEVAWIEPMGSDGKEPEHPAPVLALEPGSGEGHGEATSATTAKAEGDHGKATGSTAKATVTNTATGAPTEVALADVKKSADDAKSMGTIGIGVGIVGIVIALVALLARRKPAAG